MRDSTFDIFPSNAGIFGTAVFAMVRRCNGNLFTLKKIGREVCLNVFIYIVISLIMQCTCVYMFVHCGPLISTVAKANLDRFQ